MVVMMDREISCKCHCEKLSHFLDHVRHTDNPVPSEQNFMKLKMNFKQTRATLAGDINSAKLLVFRYLALTALVQRFEQF